MISRESSEIPRDFTFDLAICSVGYERRCRWVAQKFGITGQEKIGLEFGYLKEGSYRENRDYFEQNGWNIHAAQSISSFEGITDGIRRLADSEKPVRVFVDISSMSRDMMARIALAIDRARVFCSIDAVVAYAPSAFDGAYVAAPIRLAAPVRPELAGWSSRPDKPLGAIIGAGCEPSLTLGSLQVLEPDKAWLYYPRGHDPRFDECLAAANKHVAEIFDVSSFEYIIGDPVITRGRIAALMNSVDGDFRLVCVPFGPKIFAWLMLTTIVFEERRHVGVWSFSSREQAQPIDRDVGDDAVWYSAHLDKGQKAEGKSGGK